MQREILNNTLDQVEQVLSELHNLPEQTANSLYKESRCGAHIRHILDHWDAVLTALKSASSLIDYDKRNRLSVIEHDRFACADKIQTIKSDIIRMDVSYDAKVSIKSEFNTESQQSKHFDSSLEREWLYVINHTIHHLAHIRLILLSNNVELPAYIGIAPSTRSYLRQTEPQASTIAEKPVPA